MWYNNLGNERPLAEPDSVLVKGVKKIEGEYGLCSKRMNNRPKYKRLNSDAKAKRGSSTEPLVLWSTGNSWRISREGRVGDTAYAFVTDSCKSPLQIQGVWKLYDNNTKTWEKVINLRVERKPRSLGFVSKKSLHRKISEPLRPNPTALKAMSSGIDKSAENSSLENLLSSLLTETRIPPSTDTFMKSAIGGVRGSSPTRLNRSPREATSSRTEPKVPRIREKDDLKAYHGVVSNPAPLYSKQQNESSVFDILNMKKPYFPKKEVTTSNWLEEIKKITDSSNLPSDLQPPSDIDRNPSSREPGSEVSGTSAETETGLHFLQNHLQELCSKLQDFPNQLDMGDFVDMMDQFDLDRDKLQALTMALKPEQERLERLAVSPNEERKSLIEEKIILEKEIKKISTLFQGYESELEDVERQIEDLQRRKKILIEKITRSEREQRGLQKKHVKCVGLLNKIDKQSSTDIAEQENARSALKAITSNLANCTTSIEKIAGLMIELQEKWEKKWPTWDSYALVSWMCRLNGGSFAKYKGFWRESFEQDRVTGKNLPQLDMSTLKDLGIQILEDRSVIHKEILRLTSSHPSKELAPRSLMETDSNHLSNPRLPPTLTVKDSHSSGRMPSSHVDDEKASEVSPVRSAPSAIIGIHKEAWKNMLESWKLKQFIGAFADNGYDDITDWANLTDEELTALGMKTGHQKKFRRRIAAWSKGGTFNFSGGEPNSALSSPSKLYTHMYNGT